MPGQYNLMLDVTTSTCGSTGVPVGTTHSDVMTVTVAGGVATEVISDLGGSCNQSTITGESVVWSCVATDGTGDMANLQISATFSAGGFSGTAVVTGVSPDILGNKAGSPCSANFSLTGTRQ